jgi:hypothetical protein
MQYKWCNFLFLSVKHVLPLIYEYTVMYHKLSAPLCPNPDSALAPNIVGNLRLDIRANMCDLGHL